MVRYAQKCDIINPSNFLSAGHEIVGPVITGLNASTTGRGALNSGQSLYEFPFTTMFAGIIEC